MKKNSKQIGNNFERDCARQLSKWLTKDTNCNDLVIWRDVASGSIGTNRKKQGLSSQNVDGDFKCLDSRFEWFLKVFYVDAKCYKSWNYLFINDKNKKSNPILNQWIKTVDETPPDKISMMICHIRDNKTPEFILFPKYITFDKITNISSIQYIMNNQYDCNLFLFHDFLNKIKSINLQKLFIKV